MNALLMSIKNLNYCLADLQNGSYFYISLYATYCCAFAQKLITVPGVCLRGTPVHVVTHSFLLESSRQSLNRWRYTGLVGNLSLDPDMVIMWVSTSSSSPCFTSQRD